MIRSAALCLSILITVHAFDEKGREILVKRFGKCLDEFNLTPDELIKTREPDMDPCFIACYFKDIQIMNDKGMLDLEQTSKVAKTVPGNDFVSIWKTFPDLCKDVNEKEVSDGDKGCERAYLILECVKETSRKMFSARKQNKD